MSIALSLKVAQIWRMHLKGVRWGSTFEFPRATTLSHKTNAKVHAKKKLSVLRTKAKGEDEQHPQCFRTTFPHFNNKTTNNMQIER